MIAKPKDFKVITLRGLDEKKDIVSIMNDVMNKQDLKTGQSVIEFIITDYARKVSQLEEVKQKRQIEKDQYYQWRTKSEEENETLKQKLKTLKTAFKLLNEGDF